MLDANAIARKIISKLDNIGIDSKVDGRDSQTADMIKIIVEEIISAIKTQGEVFVEVQTAGTPTLHTGKGNGKVR